MSQGLTSQGEFPGSEGLPSDARHICRLGLFLPVAGPVPSQQVCSSAGDLGFTSPVRTRLAERGPWALYKPCLLTEGKQRASQLTHIPWIEHLLFPDRSFNFPANNFV